MLKVSWGKYFNPQRVLDLLKILERREKMTVLTPTYNRAYILNSAFESLCRQTISDFEWIIVDDGSTDNTEDLVKNWLDIELPFQLRYYKQENGGKHRALNKGIKEAKYDYILILDSDDYLTDDAVEKVHAWVKTIEGLDGFAGVAGLRGYINKTECIGGAGDGREYIDAKNTERRKYNLLGDKAEVYKTEVLREYPFPEFEGEKFLSEHVVWDAIARDGYKIRWFNEIIYKCEYLEDGLTKTAKTYSLQMENFNGFTLDTKLYIEMYPFFHKYFAIGQYYIVARLKGYKCNEIKDLIEVSNVQIFLGRSVHRLNALRKYVLKMVVKWKK